MKTSEKGLNFIKGYEDLRLEAYKPHADEEYYTIGYGHYGSDVTKGMKITKERADELFKKDIVKFERYVDSIVKVPLNQNQYDALVSFTYNNGPGNLQKLVKNRNVEQIGNCIILYNKSCGKVMNGLVRRRKEEQAMFFEDCKVDSGLPYNVKTTTSLNIRTQPNTASLILRTVPKGTILKVWAIQTVDGVEWGKNGKEYFSLRYCERIY